MMVCILTKGCFPLKRFYFCKYLISCVTIYQKKKKLCEGIHARRKAFNIFPEINSFLNQNKVYSHKHPTVTDSSLFWLCFSVCCYITHIDKGIKLPKANKYSALPCLCQPRQIYKLFYASFVISS